MARSEKLLLALASLFFAGVFWWGIFGALKAQYRFLAVKDAEVKLFVAWRKRSEDKPFVEPKQVPEWARFFVPDTQAPFAANSGVVGWTQEDFATPGDIIALYEPHPEPFHGMRSVVYFDGHYQQLSPEKWQKAQRDSGIVENPPALRPWWKFWQGGPREFFPREAFAEVCAELWLSFCILNAVWFGRWAGAFRGFGRFWFSLAASFVSGLGLGILFAIVSAILRQ